LRAAVAEHLGVAAEAILGMDLYLTDSTPATRLGQGGAVSGDLYSARHIDNLAGCATTLDGFMSSEVTPWTQIAVFFDNEEVGSRSYAGAQSGFLDRLLDRVVFATGGTTEDTFRLRARSFLLSNDGAHAGHPNFHDKYDAAYLPRLGGGPVIKEHAGLSYTSRSDTAAHFRRACRAAEVPSQVFANRSDGRSGSTIGPIIQTRSDLRSVDVGIPMLAMHSVRETAGISDLDLMTRAIAALYALGPV
ncbi:MAG: M18 family aminopeptidase, partial [bacterium]